jgi:hypothetical protein
MRTQAAQSKARKVRLIACAWLCAQAVTLTLALTASAQFAQPLLPANDIADRISTPPGQQPPQGAPPPPGDGPIPMPEISGDVGAPIAPPSGAADMTHGNRFPAGNGQNRTTVYIFSAGKQGRGSRMVQTLRPDTLSETQRNQIGGILGINMNSDEAVINANASESDLAQIQNILAPYPGANNVGGRTKISEDSPAPRTGINKPGNESLYEYQGPLPTVRTFARYLVILGVVSATVWMALAAYSVVMGSQYGGARVISAAAGLMLLLCSYTIWKIVQMNTFKANSNTPAISQNRPNGAGVSDAYMNPPDLPQTPNAGRNNPQRPGIPLEPLGGSINR